MQGFGGMGFPQVFPVFRVFYTDVVHSGHYQFLPVIIAYPVIAGLEVGGPRKSPENHWVSGALDCKFGGLSQTRMTRIVLLLSGAWPRRSAGRRRGCGCCGIREQPLLLEWNR